MKLIEKECPNCGAGLSFTKEDTTCKCEYCKREFEIERDPEKKKLVDQFSLNELKTPLKIFSYFTLGTFIANFIVFLLVSSIIIVIAFNVIKGINSDKSLFNNSATFVTTSNDLSNRDYDTLDLNSRITILKDTAGTTSEYVVKGNYKREKLYIISSKKTNILIPVYKVVYENIFDKSDEFKHTVYIPIEYRNVKSKNNSISFSLGNGKIVADEYYFNLEHSDYSYGYPDMDTLYEKVIKQYEKNYKIVEK